MKYIFLFFGNYGAGKTFLSKAITNNVVALASPIRSIAFSIFKDDKFYSTTQEDKDAPIVVPKVIPKPKGMRQSFYDDLMTIIDDFPQTYRGVLQAIGKVGRDISKNYWAELTKTTIEGILETQSIVCVDDLRYMQELKVLQKVKDVTLIPVFVYDGEELVGYELDKLIQKLDITIDNYRKKNMLKVSKGLITIETPINNLREVLIFLNSQES